MKNIFTSARPLYTLGLVSVLFFSPGCMQMNAVNGYEEYEEVEEKDKYDGPDMIAQFEFDRTKDPATGKVPRERYLAALQQTIDSKNANANAIGGLSWIERGPNSDVSGPSNGNTRANNDKTSGRIRAMMIDSTDATRKTVWIGGVDGGLWRTTDITASSPTWIPVSDNLNNLAIAAICQDPRPGFQNIMYFCTGESYFNTDAVQGNGVFKSIDGGATWTYLPSTSTYVNGTRILCDHLGNIYLATRGSGLLRSTVASGGAAWTNITPAGLVSDICDLEISSTSAAGRLHVVAGIFSTQAYRYTDIPVTVAAATWTAPAVAFPSFAMRAEICCSGSTLYSLVANLSYQVPTIYRSTDGGANWAATAAQPTAGWASGQGWYALGCDIDPSSGGLSCIVGGLDTWKTINGGTSWSQISTWVGNTPVNQYVHADVHKIIWYDGGNKLLFGCDGGVHYSTDKGSTIRDRNAGLRLKQFFSVAIHPSSTNYFLGGAQDNGTHQFSSAGLGSTVEVAGGDGAYVAIDQVQPLNQFGSYVYNTYRRSTDGGTVWNAVNFYKGTSAAPANFGNFINAYDFDNTNKIIYAGGDGGEFFRWTTALTSASNNYFVGGAPVFPAGAAILTGITGFNGSQVSAVTVSPYTANRVYFGTEAGRVVYIDGANTAVSGAAGTNISTGLPGGTVTCVNMGTNDMNLITCQSNYGINNVWVSTNGGTGWTAIDGNLPDMPVRWCMFYPGDNTKAYIATETGVWETNLINGASTVWTANVTFPAVRTDMIKYRSSDRTIAAATHGRGLWTATIPTVATPDLSFQTPTSSATEYSTFSSGCRGYTDYTKYMVIANTPTGAATVTLAIAGGATATQGVDYAITTNGNFAAPSMALSFPSGSGVAQPFTIRVYDDAAVEVAETFTINYSTSGGNAQAGASNQTLAFTINDNDAAPTASSTLTQTWGAANVSTVASGIFNGNGFTDKRLQNLYLASDLIAAGFTAGSITDFAWSFNSATVATFNNLTVSIGFTNVTTLAAGFATPAPTFTTIHSGNFTTPGLLSWYNFILPTPVAWDGMSNIIIESCFDNAAVGSDVALIGTTVAGYTASALIRQNAAGTVCASAAPNTSASRPDIRLGMSIAGTPISTALNSSKTAYLGPLDDVYFYDATGAIMARIRNLTAFDYGCTQVVIDRAGSSSVAFWNNTPAHFLASKSYRVIPTNNTTTGNYQVTLYYTSAEVTGWQSATGQLFSAASVIKVSNGFYIPDVTPAVNHIPDVSIVVGTAGAFGTNSTMMGAFSTTGFSGFGVGIPGAALPVSLVSFNGYQKDKYGVLEWKTDAEYNNKGFELEKSYDGINYSKIAFVAGAGTSALPHSYIYNDRVKLTNIQYYRLKQIDLDGRFVYSNIVVLRLNDRDKLDLLSVTNPFFTSLNLLFNKPPAAMLSIGLFDMNGRMIYSTTKMPGNTGIVETGIPPVFLPGSYVLKVTVDGEQFNKIIVKQ